MSSFTRRSTDNGFTLIETLITVIVASMFIILLNLLYVAVIRSSTSTRNQSVASSTAYSNLRKYAFGGATPTWFTCPAAADLSTNAANNNGAGQPLESGTYTNTQTTLPMPASYTINAYAPYGCGSGSNKPPVLVRSSVTYGPNSLTVTHATYVEY